MVRRRSVTGRSGPGGRRRVRRRSSGSIRRRISRLASSISAALIASKSICCRRSCSDTVIDMSMGGGSSLGCGGLSFFDANASATRREAGGGAFRLGLLLRLQQRHRGGLFGGGGVAPEQREGLVEHLLMLVAMDHRGAQRGARLGLRGEVDPGQRLLRGDRLRRADRQPGAAQQPREMHDVGRDPWVRLVQRIMRGGHWVNGSHAACRCKRWRPSAASPTKFATGDGTSSVRAMPEVNRMAPFRTFPLNAG